MACPITHGGLPYDIRAATNSSNYGRRVIRCQWANVFVCGS